MRVANDVQSLRAICNCICCTAINQSASNANSPKTWFRKQSVKFCFAICSWQNCGEADHPILCLGDEDLPCYYLLLLQYNGIRVREHGVPVTRIFQRRSKLQGFKFFSLACNRQSNGNTFHHCASLSSMC